LEFLLTGIVQLCRHMHLAFREDTRGLLLEHEAPFSDKLSKGLVNARGKL
jgi:hypothetical protein